MFKAALLLYFLGDGVGTWNEVLLAEIKLACCFKGIRNIFLLLCINLQAHFLRFGSRI